MRLKKLRQFCFIPFFIAIYLLYLISENGFNTALNRLDVVSIVTFENYNIEKFVIFSQLSIWGGILFFGLLLILFSRIYNGSMKFRKMAVFLNSLCAVGILMIFFAYTSSTALVGVNFLIAIAVGYIYYIFFFRIKAITSENQYIFLTLAALSLALIFLVREFLLLFNCLILPNIIFIWLIIFVTITIIYKYFSTKTPTFSQKLFYVSRPLFLLPLLSVLKDEIYLILNQWKIELFSPAGWYLVGFIVILFFMFFLSRHKRESVAIGKELYNCLFPLLLTGLVAIGYYTPFLMSSNDFFELANPANALFKTVIGKSIPFVDYLNSHGLSEICFGGLYILINGFSGTIDFLIYQFLFLIIYYLICYYFLLRIFGKKPIVFFFILFFPYLEFLFPKSFILALCLLFLLHRFFQQPSFRNLLYVSLFSILAAFWRFDLGFPCILITSIFLIGYLVFHYSQKMLFNYIKIIGVFLFFVLCVGMIFYLRMPEQFVSNIFQAKDYLTCNQAHAYSQIESPDLKANFYHHTLFPIVAGVMLILLLYLKRINQVSIKNNFLWLSTLFLLLFYFFNFQRGLVRHSLYEGSSSFTSVFFYLSAGLFVVLLLSHKWIRFRTAIFLVFVTVLIYVTHYPGVKDVKNLLDLSTISYRKTDKIEKLPAKTARIIDADEFANKNYNDIKYFLDTNFDKNSTFIDFSNTPMLYFYLQREVPSYFCQYMQNTVTEFLQAENLKLLQNKNIPVVLFSNYPMTWFDCTDGVPNTLRYNIICRYIYDHYAPYVVLNKHAVWIKKGIKLENSLQDSSLLFAHKPQSYYLKKYPYLLGKFGDFSVEKYDFIKIHNHERMAVPRGIVCKDSQVFLKINNLPHDTKAKFSYYKNNILMGDVEFDIFSNEENHHYLIPINAQYNWYSGLVDEISVNLADILPETSVDVLFFQQ